MRDARALRAAYGPARAREVAAQLRAIPVGRWGVAGLAGSGWDRAAGGPTGPGCAVKALPGGRYRIGGRRGRLTLVEAVHAIRAIYGWVLPTSEAGGYAPGVGLGWGRREPRVYRLAPLDQP